MQQIQESPEAHNSTLLKEQTPPPLVTHQGDSQLPVMRGLVTFTIKN